MRSGAGILIPVRLTRDLHVARLSTCGNRCWGREPRPGGEGSHVTDVVSAAGGVLRARRVETLAPGYAGDAIWWERGKVRAIGPHAHLFRSAPVGLPRYELPEALVTPGLVDGHTHFALWA